MQQPTKLSTRKKFLLWGAATISSITILKFVKGFKKPARSKAGEKTETVKMLTQEGRLVEIDKTLLTASSKKISNIELQQWIKK